MGQAGGDHRRRRLYPDRGRLQARTWHGQPDGRLRPRRRRHPRAERKIRNDLVSQRRALVGAHPFGDRRVSGAPSVGCGAAILDEGRLLLIKRRRPPEAGHWSLVGGKVEFLESVEAAVRREALEEVGLEIELIRPLFVSELLGVDDSHWVSPVYEARALTGKAQNREPEKIDALVWAALS